MAVTETQGAVVGVVTWVPSGRVPPQGGRRPSLPGPPQGPRGTPGDPLTRVGPAHGVTETALGAPAAAEGPVG